MKTRFACVSASLLCSLAGLNPALAGGPESMDRIPTNAAVVISIRNMESFVNEFEAFEKSMGLPEDSENPIEQASALLGTKGLNKGGSMSLAIMPEADGKVNFDGQEPNGVIIVPVLNYGDFAKGMGATSVDGVQNVKFDDKDAYIKDIGGGYAALSNQKATLEAFEGKAGMMAAHSKTLGSTGGMIADRSDMVLVVNMPLLREKIEEGITQAKQEMEDSPIGAMGGQGIMTSMERMFTFASDVARDAEVTVLGVNMEESGVSFDFGANFRADSEMAAYFAEGGDSSSMMTRLPNQAFLVAGAMDTSSASVRKILKGIGEFSAEMQKSAQEMAAAAGAGEMPDMTGMMSMLERIDQIKGMSFSMGASPSGIMGGLLTNTSMYIATTDAAGYVNDAKKSIEAMNSQKAAEMTFKSTYNPKALTIGGVEIDTWNAQIIPAEDDPNAMQMQMVMNMIFGPGGMGGMNAVVGEGIVSTMSENSQLMTAAIKAAKNGDGLGTDAALAAVQSNLPPKRIFEVYLGTQSIMESVAGLMSMMGGEQAFAPPEKVSPIAIAGTAGKGGMAMHLFLPADVIKAISEISAQMEGGGEDEMEEEEVDGEPAPAGSKPRF